MATYGARTGVTTLIRTVDFLCRLYVKFSKYIDPWVATQVPLPGRTTVQTFLTVLQATCIALNAASDD
jgi:hypothetical protein